MITSTANEKIKRYAKLLDKKHRKLNSMFIVEGKNLVEEAAKAGVVIEVLTSDGDNRGTLVAPFVMKKLTNAVTSQGVIAVCKFPEPKKLGERILALDNVQDPGNVGTLIRSARAFGFTDVIVSGAGVYSPKTLRSSQGAIFGINIIQTKDITEFFDDYQVIGSLLDKKASNYKEVKPKGKFILVMGNEGKGISKEVQDKLTDKVYIPIEFESLNVSTAGAILLNEYKKS